MREREPGCSPEGIVRGNLLLIALSAVMRHPRAFVERRRALMFLTPSFRRRAIALSAALYRNALVGLKLAAGAPAGATVAMAVMNHIHSKRHATGFEPGRNETVVYRQTRNSHATIQYDQAEPSEEAGYQTDGTLPYYPRAVQTVSFLNPDVRLPAVAASPGAVKVGGFVAFPGKEAAEIDTALRSTRKRSGGSMDVVDDYLWEVYQREPVKRDGSGDFTWKDPAAAKRVSMSLPDYVIGGMDPEFREQLYHAGKAMDADGIHWSILSAFRDDYRQRLASGFKASVGNSLHGGSRRTGGYGHGRALDITGLDDTAEDVWHWIDKHGGKYGLHRPMPGNDPAHIQQRGDWHKIAMGLRDTRLKLAGKQGPERDAPKSKVAKASN